MSSTRRSSVGQEGDPDLEVDRGRQDEAVVVVGVLADQVDPAGGADDEKLLQWRRRGRRIERPKPIAKAIGIEDVVATMEIHPGSLGTRGGGRADDAP